MWREHVEKEEKRKLFCFFFPFFQSRFEISFFVDFDFLFFSHYFLFFLYVNERMIWCVCVYVCVVVIPSSTVSYGLFTWKCHSFVKNTINNFSFSLQNCFLLYNSISHTHTQTPFCIVLFSNIAFSAREYTVHTFSCTHCIVSSLIIIGFESLPFLFTIFFCLLHQITRSFTTCSGVECLMKGVVEKIVWFQAMSNISHRKCIAYTERALV